jgi:hypothetical protein
MAATRYCSIVALQHPHPISPLIRTLIAKRQAIERDVPKLAWIQPSATFYCPSSKQPWKQINGKYVLRICYLDIVRYDRKYVSIPENESSEFSEPEAWRFTETEASEYTRSFPRPLGLVPVAGMMKCT